MGDKGSAYTSIIQGALSDGYAKAHPKSANIPAIIQADYLRQMDFVSCGTDAFLVLKEVFNMTPNIFDFFHNKQVEFKPTPNFGLARVPYIPAVVAKYAQGSTSLKELVSKHSFLKDRNIVNKKRTEHKESVLEYDQRHEKMTVIKTVKKLDEKTTVITEVKKLAYDALNARRMKHVVKVGDALAVMDDKSLENAIRKSSGLNLLTENMSKLLPLFMDGVTGEPNLQVMKLIGIGKVSASPSGIDSVDYSAIASKEACLEVIGNIEARITQCEKDFFDGKCISMKSLAMLFTGMAYIQRHMDDLPELQLPSVQALR